MDRIENERYQESLVRNCVILENLLFLISMKMLTWVRNYNQQLRLHPSWPELFTIIGETVFKFKIPPKSQQRWQVFLRFWIWIWDLGLKDSRLTTNFLYRKLVASRECFLRFWIWIWDLGLKRFATHHQFPILYYYYI